MSYARRTDANHGPVLSALARVGWYVRDTSAVPDFFDAIIARRGVVHFLEIKDGAKSPSRRQLRPNQAELHAMFRRAGASVVILESVEEAVRL